MCHGANGVLAAKPVQNIGRTKKDLIFPALVPAACHVSGQEPSFDSIAKESANSSAFHHR
jgi:hypothetical protein